MFEITLFLVTAVAAVLDPLAAVGYIAAGLAAREWWHAPVAAAAWAACLNLFVAAAFRQYHVEPNLLFAAIVGYAVAALAVFGIKREFVE